MVIINTLHGVVAPPCTVFAITLQGHGRSRAAPCACLSRQKKRTMLAISPNVATFAMPYEAIGSQKDADARESGERPELYLQL